MRSTHIYLDELYTTYPFLDRLHTFGEWVQQLYGAIESFTFQENNFKNEFITFTVYNVLRYTHFHYCFNFNSVRSTIFVFVRTWTMYGLSNSSLFAHFRRLHNDSLTSGNQWKWWCNIVWSAVRVNKNEKVNWGFIFNTNELKISIPGKIAMTMII